MLNDQKHKSRHDEMAASLIRTSTYFIGCGSFSREVVNNDAAGEFLKTIGGAF